MRRFVSSPPRPKGMKRTNGRSIAITLSASLPDAQRKRSCSLPTTSVVSRRGAPRCRLARLSASGWIVSRRCKQIRTSETGTGMEKPWPGRISTFPSIRGCRRIGDVSLMQQADKQEQANHGWRGKTNVPESLKCQDSRRESCCLEDRKLARLRGPKP